MSSLLINKGRVPSVFTVCVQRWSMLKIIIINLVSDEAQNSLIIVYSETQAPTREESTRAQSTLLAVAVL